MAGWKVQIWSVVLALAGASACFGYTARPSADNDPQHQTLSIAGSEIEIALPSRQLDQVSTADLLDWTSSAAKAVSAYYGRFPVSHLSLRIRARGGSGVWHGVTFPTDGGLISISVGQQTPPAELRNDWTMTHEMIHLAFPSMEESHHWIEEGLSTYVEPVARAKVGQLSEVDVWKQFVENMPKGQPESGDEGLDNTHTWGRTYWGGALFCLIADVKIREHTHNRKGLQDALHAILDHGGVITQDWPIEKTLAIGDHATHTTVLVDLYREMANRPVTVDLEKFWKKLGVSVDPQSDQVTFDDHASEAQIRKAILSRDSL